MMLLPALFTISTELAVTKFSESDLPALYQAADKVASRAQKRYTALFRADLIFLLIAAFVASFPADRLLHPTIGNIEAGIKVVCLVLSFVLSLYIRFGETEQQWIESRFIAESIKSLAWRYMAGGTSFVKVDETASELAADSKPTPVPDNSKTKDIVGAEFLNNLNEIVRKSSVSSAIAPKAHTIEQNNLITPEMRNQRDKDFVHRKKNYVKNRLENQQEWYADKADQCRSRKEIAFYVILACQFCAVLCALLTALLPTVVTVSGFTLTPTGLLTTFAAGGLAWTQFRQYQQLANRYGATSYKLMILASESETTESADFAGFVDKVEQCLTSENQEWYDKRINK